MGLFDRVEQKEFEEFRSEVTAIFHRLEQKINEKVTDSEQTAKTAAENAVAMEAQVRTIASTIERVLAELESYKATASNETLNLQSANKEAIDKNAELLIKLKSTEALYDQALKADQDCRKIASEASEKLQTVNAYLEESKELPDTLAKTQKLLEDSKALGDSISNLLNHSIKKKSEIDELHKEIYGEDIKDEDGKLEHVDGLKDQLEQSYNKVADKTNALDADIKRLIDAITADHTAQKIAQEQDFKDLLVESNRKINAVNEQLTGLLPGAMAEGLSAAYEKKKDDETTALKSFEEGFRNAIGGMVLVSLIPFAVDIFLLISQKKDLLQVIQDTPSLIISILPLYFPVLWLAYSSNKKINLSKRLIEEYTHKAVLGKTFSGLSNQIETLPNQSVVKEELRTRLLFNVLQVSAENPGKLITNYNKSDHPLMDALESSAKLSDAVDALAKLPGFAAITKKLSERSEKLLDIQNKKIESGLVVQASLETGTKKSEEKATS